MSDVKDGESIIIALSDPLVWERIDFFEEYSANTSHRYLVKRGHWNSPWFAIRLDRPSSKCPWPMKTKREAQEACLRHYTTGTWEY